MATVRWTVRGLGAFDAVSRFLEYSSSTQASRFEDQIDAAAQQLAHFPLSGRFFRTVDDIEIRELVIAPYRLFYHLIADDEVEILTVMHGRQDIERVLRSPWRIV